MMKKYLWLLLMLIASSSLAAQQTVTFPPDYKVMNRATKYNANFTELYGLPSYGISSSDISTWNAKQNRVSGVCGTGYAIRTVNVDGTVTCEATGGGGVSTWLGLTDTPSSYTADYWVKVNSAGTGLELTAAPSGGGDMLLGTAQTITANKIYSDAAAAVFGTDGDWSFSSSTAGQLDVASSSATDTVIDIVNNGSGSVNMTLHGAFTADAYASPQTSSGPQFTVFREDSDNGSNYVGWGSQAANNNDLILLFPTADPTANQVLQFAAPSPVTFSDGVTRDASVGSWVTMGSGSSANIVDTDPTSSSPTGEYWSRASGDLFYVVNDGGANDGIFQVAGTWTPAAVTYTLTVTAPGNGDSITCSDSDLSVAINCGNGNSDCSATASSGASITGMTATAASGRQFDNWTGDVTGSENPTTTALVMDGNKSVGAAFSASGVAMSHHFKFDAAGGTGNDQIYDEVTGTWVGSGAGTVTFTTDGTRTIIQSDADTDRVSVPALDNINYSDNLTIEVTTKAPVWDGNIYSYYFVQSGDFLSYMPYRTGGNASVGIRCNYNTLATADFTAVSQDTWHTVRALIDFTNQTLDIYLDGTLQTHSADLTGLEDWTTLSGNLYFAYVNSGTNTIQVDEVKIWHGLVAP